jgi:hypothetical protein
MEGASMDILLAGSEGGGSIGRGASCGTNLGMEGVSMDILLAGSAGGGSIGRGAGCGTNLVSMGYQWTPFWQVLKVVGVLAGVLALKY